MGCDIHLYVEKRQKEGLSLRWIPSSFRGYFSERVYEMFAALNNVRNDPDWNIKPLQDKGIPDYLGFRSFYDYYITIVEDPKNRKNVCSKEQAEEWVRNKYSTEIEMNEIKYCSDPDWHSPNWCTVQEMEQCYNQVFKDEKGDYIEWLALINYMKTLESNGEYEVRAVFWFDS